MISRNSAGREGHRIVLVPHSDIWRVRCQRQYQGQCASHIQYVLGIFGAMKEEVILFKKDSLCGGEVSDLSLNNSKVIWAVKGGHLRINPVNQTQGAVRCGDLLLIIDSKGL